MQTSSDDSDQTARPRGRRLKFAGPGTTRRLSILAAFLGVCVLGVYFVCLSMPGRTFSGPAGEPSVDQVEAAARLEATVRMLAEDIGARNMLLPRQYGRAAVELSSSLEAMGYDVQWEHFQDGLIEAVNLVVESPGTESPKQVLVVGAHYDSCESSPAANDNASGVAVTLELARRFKDRPSWCTIRFVCFANEEPPYFKTDAMGSLAHARGCAERGDAILGMISLETMGYFRRERGTQEYPIDALGLVYPDRGDFLAFVGNLSSRRLIRGCVREFRASAEVPSEGVALPGWIEGVSWSDHWAFWQHGYPGLMVTDTAPYRYPHYHTLEDTPEKLDYLTMARAAGGLEAILRGDPLGVREQGRVAGDKKP